MLQVFGLRGLSIIHTLLQSMPQVGIVLVLNGHATFIRADQPHVGVVLHIHRSRVFVLRSLFGWLRVYRQRTSNLLSHPAYLIMRDAVQLRQLAYYAAEGIRILIFLHLALHQAHLLVTLRQAYLKQLGCACRPDHYLIRVSWINDE